MKLLTLLGLVFVFVTATMAIPTITPAVEDITITPDDTPGLQCSGDSETNWYFPSDIGYNLNVQNKVQDDGKFVSTLLLNGQLTNKNVGYYYCVAQSDEPINQSLTTSFLLHLFERGKAARIYVYIDYPDVALNVVDEESMLTAYSGEVLLIPCHPTRKNVEVKLYHYAEHLSETPFNPKEGFQLAINGVTQSGDYKCIFNGSLEVSHYVDVSVNAHKTPTRPLVSSNYGKIFNEEGNIELICKNNESFLETSWKLPTNSRALMENRVEYIRTLHLENKLIVKDAKLSDSGRYTCIASTKDNSWTGMDDIDIKVVDSCHITMREPNDQYTMTIHDRLTPVRWVVEFDGHPKPLEVQWLDPRNQIISAHSDQDKFYTNIKTRSQGDFTAEFHISDPVLDDMGTYVMRVFHDERCEERKSFKLIVLERPDVSVNETTARLGEEVHVSCIVVGNPPSSIHWTWTECPLGDAELSHEWSLDTHCDGRGRQAPMSLDEHAIVAARNELVQNSTLSFTPSAPGRLTCSARNNMSATEATAQSVAVYVLERNAALVTEVRPPDVLVIGAMVELECLAGRYNYTDALRWQRSDGSTVEDSGDGRVQIVANRLAHMHRLVLRFAKITRADVDDYVCVATTFENVESRRRQTMRVHDRESPRFDGDRPDAGRTITIEVNERLEVWCAPTGWPVPEVTWWLNGDVALINDERVQIDTTPAENMQFNHTLVVAKMSDEYEGVIRCLARNSDGEAVLDFPVDMKSQVSKLTIGLVVGLLLLLLLATGLGLFFYRREHKKFLVLKHAGISYFDNGDMSNYNPDLSRMEQADLLPYDKKYEFPRHRLRLSNVKLGAGAFGVVYKAQALNIVPDVAESTVAVKTIKNTDKDEDIKALISELKIMIHMGKHVNVVNLLGAVTRDIRKRSLYVITEFCDLGNLYNFLKKNRGYFVNQVEHVSDEINPNIHTIQQQSHEMGVRYINIGNIATNNNLSYSSKPYYVNDREPDGGPPTISATFDGSLGLNSDAALISVDTTRASHRSYTTTNGGRHSSGYVHNGNTKITTTDLVCWSFQVARGMDYLASRGVLHGDLAARNILLCSDNVVKICDFGLSRSLRPEEDYQKESDGLLPVKWLAIESISHKIFNTSTDVWSFGIVMWELFSLAQVPYTDVPTEKMLPRLQDGHRLLRPRYATQALYEIMRECWYEEPAHRPRFEVLARRLGDMLPPDVVQQFVDMNDEYMQVNIAEGRDKGDYLSVLLAPETMAPAVPHASALVDIERGGGGSSYDEDRVPESIPMLPRTDVRASSPLARSDTDTDLDKEWRHHSALANIAPRTLPPQNNYVNLPAVPTTTMTTTTLAADADAVSNPGYVFVKNGATGERDGHHTRY